MELQKQHEDLCDMHNNLKERNVTLLNEHSKLKETLSKSSELIEQFNKQQKLISDLELHMKELIVERDKVKAINEQSADIIMQLRNQVEELKTHLREIESSFEEKCNHLSSTELALEEEKRSKDNLNKLLKDHENEIQKQNELLNEASNEREVLQQQYNEQIVKNSTLKDHLDEARRIDTPHTEELRVKVFHLQEELKTIKLELNEKERLVEESNFHLNDMKQKLLLREEELQRITSQQPSSLPQTFSDQKTTELQNLRSQMNEMKKQLNEYKRRKMVTTNEGNNGGIVSSEAIAECIAEEHKIQTEALKSKFSAYSQSIVQVIENIRNGQSMDDILKMLEEIQANNNDHTIPFNYTPNDEILRKVSMQSMEPFNITLAHNFDRTKTTSITRTEKDSSMSDSTSHQDPNDISLESLEPFSSLQKTQLTANKVIIFCLSFIYMKLFNLANR